MVDIRENSQVVGETGRDFQAGKVTLTGFFNRIRNNAGNIQVRELVGHELNKSRTLCGISTESFATRIKNCSVLQKKRKENQNKK